MEIRHLNAADDRLAVSGIFEASWKCAYRYILPGNIWRASWREGGPLIWTVKG
ncbi:hypothetical protein [uncultured Oscillibacter sp.]|uniref:hypothetical protein n=1 Tax=uncultured Oscillibacter sp. TaxID=876091 RepID=UPI0026300690|nr:hypothetical protein [uncultured Oscillibacter sp.]